MRRAIPAVLLLLAACLTACDQSMTEQKRYDTYGPASIWPDGTSARPLPEGVVAEGDLDREAEARDPPPVTPDLLQQGRVAYDAICSPCHGLGGDGDGMIVRRGFPPPPSYHEARLRAAPARHFLDVIEDGYGVMYAYPDRVAPRDRWAVVAYIRALQLSRRATLAQAPEAAERLPP